MCPQTPVRGLLLLLLKPVLDGSLLLWSQKLMLGVVVAATDTNDAALFYFNPFKKRQQNKCLVLKLIDFELDAVYLNT